jgi:RES domain-containing protein
MIFTALEGVAAYRMHQPVWAMMPTSGAGAGRHGGRVNRPGVDALYLSLDSQTAIAEYRQTSSLLPPGTLVAYTVSVTKLIDFTGGYRSSWPPLWQEFFCDWRKLWFDQRVEPPSWALGDEAIAAGAKGILFMSIMNPGGRNLVLFTNRLNADDQIQVFDPDGVLPKNQDSWK